MNMYITEMVPRKRKLKEEDQVLMVGRYNVSFYFDEYLQGGKAYYLLKIEEFDGIEQDAKFVQSRILWITKGTEDTYGIVWQLLHDKNLLGRLMNGTKDNQRIYGVTVKEMMI